MSFMGELILPPSAQEPKVDQYATQVWENQGCEGMAMALAITDEMKDELAESGEDITEIAAARSELVEACNVECSRPEGCAVRKIMELTTIGLVPHQSLATEIFSEVQSVIAHNASKHDGLIGVLAPGDRYMRDVVNTRLDPFNAKLLELGLEPVTLTNGAWQQLGDQCKGNLRVAIAATHRLARVMAEIQDGNLLLGSSVDIAEKLVQPPVIHNQDVRNLFEDDDFAYWVDLAQTPKGQLGKALSEI